MCTLLALLQSINILVFGHSFGVDCTEYLPSLAVEAGINDLYVGRFIKANCSLEEHYAFFKGDTTSKYSECRPGQTKYKRVKKSVREALGERKWDYVIFQNSLENEGRYETAQPFLNELVAFTLKTQKEKFGKEPTIGWNMFWPISKLMEDGKNKMAKYRLSFYDNSSEKMWEAYQKATEELSKDTGISLIIPSGAAIMAFRASEYNTPEINELTRDGYHMSLGGGRYLAACVWFEKLITPHVGASVVGNGFRVDREPFPVTDTKTAKYLQKLAKQAVKDYRSK